MFKISRSILAKAGFLLSVSGVGFLGGAPVLAQDSLAPAQSAEFRFQIEKQVILNLFEALDTRTGSVRLAGIERVQNWLYLQKDALTPAGQDFIAEKLVEYINLEATRTWDPSPNALTVAFKVLGQMKRFDAVLDLVESHSKAEDLGKWKKQGIEKVLTVDPARDLPGFLEVALTPEEKAWNIKAEQILIRILRSIRPIQQNPGAPYLRSEFVEEYLDHILSGFCRFSEESKSAVCRTYRGARIIGLRLSESVIDALIQSLGPASSLENLGLLDSLSGLLYYAENPAALSRALNELERVNGSDTKSHPRLYMWIEGLKNVMSVRLATSTPTPVLVLEYLDHLKKSGLDSTQNVDRMGQRFGELYYRLNSNSAEIVLAESSADLSNLKTTFNEVLKVYLSSKRSSFQPWNSEDDLIFKMAEQLLTPLEMRDNLIDPILADSTLLRSYFLQVVKIVRNPQHQISAEFFAKVLDQGLDLTEWSVDPSSFYFGDILSTLLAAEIDTASDPEVIKRVKDSIARAKQIKVDLNLWKFVLDTCQKTKGKSEIAIQTQNALLFEFFNSEVKTKSIYRFSEITNALENPIAPEILREIVNQYGELKRNSSGTSPDAMAIEERLGISKSR